MKRIKMSFTLSEAIVNELNFMSEELGEKKSHLIEKALDYYFSCVDLKLVEKSIQAVNNGEKTYSMEEVFGKPAEVLK